MARSVGWKPSTYLGGVKRDEARDRDRKVGDVAEPQEKDQRLERYTTWDKEDLTERSSIGP